jgi:hypothetical protein
MERITVISSALTGYSNNTLLWVAWVGFWFILQKVEHSLGHLLKIMYVN